MDRRGAGRGLKDGLTCIVPAVSRECLFVGLALHPVPAQEPMCYWEVAVLEEYFSRDVTVFREIAMVRAPVVWWCLPDLGR